jgi:L-cystine transport system permease protein
LGNLFDVRLVFEYFPEILSKFHITLLIVFVAILIGVSLGLIIAIIRLCNIPILSRLAIVYVSFIRGTPIIIQLFIVYYGLPSVLELVDIDINQWGKIYFVLIAYGFNNAAFMSEIIRSAILSVPDGQKEAAYSIGLTKWQTLKRVILPQAVLIAVPVFGTRVINTFESTSLAFTLGILDMVGQAEAIGSRTYHELEGYIVLAIVFAGVSILLEKMFSIMERKFVEARR